MLLPHGLLVLVVDGSRVQLLRNRGSEGRPELEAIASRHIGHPPTHELGTDRPGRSFGSASNTRHAYAETDLHEQEEEAFAAAAMDDLASRSGEEAAVVLIAPPRMLGHLRKLTSPDMARRIVGMFDRDLTKKTADEICDFLVGQK